MSATELLKETGWRAKKSKVINVLWFLTQAFWKKNKKNVTILKFESDWPKSGVGKIDQTAILLVEIWALPLLDYSYKNELLLACFKNKNDSYWKARKSSNLSK